MHIVTRLDMPKKPFVIEPDGTDPAEYFHRQRRFKDEEIDLDETRRACSDRMQRLKALAEQYPATG